GCRNPESRRAPPRRPRVARTSAAVPCPSRASALGQALAEIVDGALETLSERHLGLELDQPARLFDVRPALLGIVGGKRAILDGRARTRELDHVLGEVF